jgi:DNA repair protein SbcC/Rad50
VRLHRLEVTAFGPFADTVRVDFDRLSDAGLFLLSGATGAGKTSVLDAVCFALYGDVPGDRATAKRLRADQADPDVAPVVELEATLSGRRFRIVRSPVWQRPKKRGSGTTTAQASVQVAERVDGAWVTLATRLDEAGLLVSGLVGMTLAQFTQVAMLPQGRFQTFLRARSDDRHKLLHQLFRTGRFEAVEGWLRERRLALRREGEAAHCALADLVSRTSEAVASPLPDGWDVHDLTEPATDGSLAAWALGLSDGARHQSARAWQALDQAVAGEVIARRLLDHGRALAARRAAVDAARAERAALDAQAAEVAALAGELEAATRAAAVTPVHRLVARAAGSLATARAQAAALDVDEADRDRAAAAELTALDAAAAVRAALPTESALTAVTERLAADEARCLELMREREAAELDHERATRLDAIGAHVVEVEHHIEAGLSCERLEAELVDARAAHLDARELAAARRDELFEVHRARIEGMAAELAGALVVGGSCPVCGSAEHPHKAIAGPHAPNAEAERAARQLLDDANLLEHAQASRVHDLTTQLGAARARGGEATLGVLRGQLADLRAEAAGLVAGLGRLDSDPVRHQAHVADLHGERARLDERLRLGREEQARSAAVVAALLDGTDADDLASLLAVREQQVEHARRSLRALDAVAAAAASYAEASDALDAALVLAGFADADQAVAAARPAEHVAVLTDRVRDHNLRLAAVAAVLEAPDVDEVCAAPLPDLDALTTGHAECLDSLGAARSAAERWAQRAERLADLTGRLTGALETWRPLHDEWRLTAELSAFCEGKSPDNRLQMRLSAYVLAFRLSQVVAAANERLAAMSDQRYALEHTGRAGAGETRGGLSLLVRDEWSGESRDPATLSGGETFVVSLALALGLADVITHEAGGADLDTLFVDEGFGSLDADTLDDVLDTLDGLRDGGRVVGVVSHVAEMRDRIPTQLVVTKARSGSTVSVRG